MSSSAPASGSLSTTNTAPLESEFSETRSVTLEWKVSGLKALFESSRGDAKSKCLKSALFDSERWQIFFYPNSGSDQFCSLYLSCEPTSEEREKGSINTTTRSNGKDKENGKTPWKREGKFKFSFEARSLDRRMLFKTMEASDHTFSDTARNWGYQNFYKRQDAWYNNPVVRAADAFLIICTIVHSPTSPSPPLVPRLLIPKDLVNAFSSLFDDPDYSDIVFRIRPVEGRERGGEKKVFASKKILEGRSDYFQTMFSSGFNESRALPLSMESTVETNMDQDRTAGKKFASIDSDEDDWDEDDDSEVDGSENEDEDDDEDDDADVFKHAHDENTTEQKLAEDLRSSTLEEREEDMNGSNSRIRPRSSSFTHDDDISTRPALSATSAVSDDDQGGGGGGRREDTHTDPGRLIHQSPSKRSRQSTTPMTTTTNSPTTKRGHQDENHFVEANSRPHSLLSQNGDVFSTREDKNGKDTRGVDGRPRFEVVVTDAAYPTFKALLYYLYTDSIFFTPLSSTYHVAKEAAQLQARSFPFPTRRSYLLAATGYNPSMMGKSAPSPCSAKAIYRLADKLGLIELKKRAYDHIIRSLTVENIPYEVFGSFSLRNEEIKRVEIAFLLDKWNEVRASPAMKQVFNQIRVGRFPGFEDVWSRILESLEYRPKEIGVATEEG